MFDPETGKTRYRRRNRLVPVAILILIGMVLVYLVSVTYSNLSASPRPLPAPGDGPLVVLGETREISDHLAPTGGALKATEAELHALVPEAADGLPRGFDEVAEVRLPALDALEIGRGEELPVGELRQRLAGLEPAVVLLPVPDSRERAATYTAALLATASSEAPAPLYLYGPEEAVELSAGSRELVYEYEIFEGEPVHLAPANHVRLGPGGAVAFRQFTGEGETALVRVRRDEDSLSIHPGEPGRTRVHLWALGEGDAVYRSYEVAGGAGVAAPLEDLGDPQTVVSALCDASGERCGAAFALRLR
jgi:hypothetical protein